MQDYELSQKVYRIVDTIKSGQVMTYGQIAMLVGKPHSARQIGRILATVPKNLALPCHRVVRADGVLAPDEVFGSRSLQRDLLLQEGIPFTNNGRIDFARLYQQ